MEKAKSKFRHPVWAVHWADAFVDTKDFDQADAEKTEPVWRTTVGFLVARNQHGIVMATDEYRDPDLGVAAKLFIPHSMVNEITILIPKKPRKRKP